MAVVQSVKLGNGLVDLHTFRGEVMDEKKWATTTVSGGGGGGYVQQGTGYMSTSPITSETTTHDQLFLRSEDGQERAFKATNIDFPVRKGHLVSVLWGIQHGKDKGPFIAFYNHTTNNLENFEISIKDLAVKEPRKFYRIGGIGFWILVGSWIWFINTEQMPNRIIGLVGVILLGVGLIGLAASKITEKKSIATLRSAVDHVIAQIKSQK